jgi:hypothetical protein
MKKLNLVLSAICISALSIAQNGAAIEYKITSSKGAGGTMKVNYSEFGNLSEFNMSAPSMPGGGMKNKSLSMKSNPDVIYMINDQNKTYSEMKKGQGQQGGEDNRTYTVKKIGTETVAGYKCTHAIVNDGKESHDIWTTKDIADYSKYAEALDNGRKMGSSKEQKALKDAGCEGFPAKVSHKNEREGEFTMELVKIEKKNFSKSDFELPAGYSKSAGPGAGGPAGAAGMPGMKTQEEIMKMTPEERAKWAEEMKKQYGGQQKK